MPELPEVETICRTLAPMLVGSAFARAELVWPGCVANGSASDFEASLAGSLCTGISRRGKYLLIALDHSRWLGVHLRMTGRFTMMDSGADRDRHLRAVLHLKDGRELHFIDQRKFGRLALAIGVDGLRHFLRRLGPEPVIDDAGSSHVGPGHDGDGGGPGFEQFPNPDFMTSANLASRFSGRRAPIKSLLLDQKSVAGLGNIYVDEALFRACIHPLRSAGSLGADEIETLCQAIHDALAQGSRTAEPPSPTTAMHSVRVDQTRRNCSSSDGTASRAPSVAPTSSVSVSPRVARTFARVAKSTPLNFLPL